MDEKTGKIILGFSGLSGTKPCLYRDKGDVTNVVVDNVKNVEQIQMLDGIHLSELEDFGIDTSDSYASRLGGGFTQLIELPKEIIDELVKYNKQELERLAKVEKEDAQEEKIKWAKSQIKQAEVRKNNNSKLLSNKEELEWRKHYNNTANEGENGYVPTRVTVETYNLALEILEKNE